MTWERIGKELEERIARLMGSETVKFCDLRTDELRAIAFNEPFIVDGEPFWDELKIYKNPLKLSEESYAPLNPNYNARFRATKILTFDFLYVRRREEEEYLGLLADIFGRRGKKYMKYSFGRKQNPEGISRVVSWKTEVIPIYAGNEDFLSIMAQIEATGGN